MYKCVVAFLVVISISLAACPASGNINNVLADSVTFNANSDASVSMQTYNYQFQSTFTATPSVAIAIQSFAFSQVGPHNFTLRPLTLTTTQVQFQFQYTASVWASIKASFWVSANPQLQVGFFEVNSLQTGPGQCEGCAIVNTNIKSAFPSNQNPVIRVFLNGYNLNARSGALQVSAAPTNLQGTNLTIKVTMGTLTVIDRVALSWIAFSPSTANFVSYGGQVSQSKFTGSVSSDISSTIYRSQYTIYGLSLISITSGKAISFSSSVSSDFILSISSSIPIDSFSLTYVALGAMPSSLCANCGAEKIVNGNTCVSQCPTNTYAFTYKDGAVACRSCSAALGLILVGGQCVKGVTTTSTTTTTTIVTNGANSSGSGSSSGSAGVTAATSTTGTALPVPTVTPTIPTPVNLPNPNSGCFKNAYWNGAECVCEVGYVYLDGQCKTPNIAISVPIIITYPGAKKGCANEPTTPVQCTNQNQVSNGTACVCINGYTRNNSGVCVKNTTTPTNPTTPQCTGINQVYNGATCVCISGYVRSNANVCVRSSIPTTPVTCGANSYDNGLGVCVCNTGFYKSGSICIQGTPCGVNSVRNSDGTCSCQQGYTNYNGACSQCPPGAFWSTASNKCIFVCGQNSAYSETAKACTCLAGFGLINNQCQKCPADYFISNGYCVTCPVNSAYNAQKGICDCKSGYYTNQYGICTQKCQTNEVYDASTQRCVCLKGLGRISGVCTICPAGTQVTDDGSSCNNCKANEELSNGKCVCKAGYAINSASVCTPCNELPNGFILNGFCSVCPRGQIVIGGNSCGCPQGKVRQGAACISQCQADELLDSAGNCYTCGSNQVISNGQCVCKEGYNKNSCGVCTLACSSGQFPFQGGCAVCPLNTIYKAEINGCDCPTGSYKDLYGVCQKLELKPIECPDGQYFDSSRGCVACPGSCKTCSSATKCTSCAIIGYAPNSAGQCVTKCGDGLILGAETCDTGNAYSAGCVNCQVQTGYTCSGQPSVCKSNVVPVTPTVPTNPTPVTPVTPTIPTTAQALTKVDLKINTNNVFVTLKTNPTFTFDNPTEMQNFMKVEFPSGPKPTVYCSQKPSPDLNLFDCLLIYPSGVSNNVFDVKFSYNYQGKSGSTTVSVDALSTISNSRIRNR